MVIAVVGIGLDGKEGLNFSTRKIVEQATVLAGSNRHLGYYYHHPAEKISLANLQIGLDQIAQLAFANHSIVILASGDPLFFGLGRLLLANFPAEEIQFYPHFSSVQLAFSRIKVPWQDARLCSVHGRSTDELIKLLKQGYEKIAILTDSQNNPAEIARLFLALDLPVCYSFHICENLGDPTEQISYFSPEQVPQLSNLDQDNFAVLNVLVLLRQKQINHLELNNLPLIGIPDSSFLSFSDRPSLITKKEIRIAILGELSLQFNQTVWDIGAGTGSVSIEMARLSPSSQILAIEKTSMGSALITQNCQRFNVNNITNIYGKAPEALINLPQPDRIFIGGSGGNLVEILNVCDQKLTDQGVMVLSFATIEHSYQALGWLSKNSWQYRLLQLQIARSTPVQHLTRFTPLNPVTIITATRNNSQ